MKKNDEDKFISDNHIRLTRYRLYHLVWSKPLSQLSEKYSLSYNELKKICIENKIPIPQNGYWQKLRFGKKVEVVPLPQIDNKDEIILDRIEGEKKEKIIVPSKLTKPHKYTITTKQYYKKLKAKKKSRRYVEIDSANVLSIDVSEKLLSRSFRFMDSLIKALEDRGYKVEVDKSTKVIIENQEYNLRLAEKNKRVKRESNYGIDWHDLAPTGNLVLRAYTYIPLREWADTKTKKLEDKLGDILLWLEKKAKEDKKQQIASEIWHQQYKIKKKKEEEFNELRRKEIELFESLYISAERYQKTLYIRNYIDKLESIEKEKNTITDEKKKWIEWARDKADWYDPFIEKEDDLLKGIDRDKL